MVRGDTRQGNMTDEAEGEFIKVPSVLLYVIRQFKQLPSHMPLASNELFNRVRHHTAAK